MADIYFMGAEPSDFTPYGSVGVTAGASAFRRAWLSIGPGGGSTLLTSQYAAPLRQATSALYFTCRLSVGQAGGVSPDRPFVLFRSNTARVIGFGIDPATKAFTVIGFTAGTPTVLLTGAQPGGYAADTKIDLHFDLASGRVRLWVGGVNQFDAVLDPTGFGGGSVDALSLANPDGRENGGALLISEVVAAAFDLRAYRLATLGLTGDTATKEWTGSFADIDEVDWQAVNDSLSTLEVNKSAVFDVASPPTGSFTIAGVKMAGVFERGGSGPGSVQFLSDGGTGTIQTSPTQVLDQGLSFLAQYLDVNPETGAAWTNDELSKIKIGIKSGV